MCLTGLFIDTAQVLTFLHSLAGSTHTLQSLLKHFHLRAKQANGREFGLDVSDAFITMILVVFLFKTNNMHTKQ